MTDERVAAPLSSHRESAGVVVSVLVLAAVAWLISLAQMSGMDMGTATELGSFEHFLPLWLTMMAAMMLPGTTASLFRQIAADRDVRAVPSFLLGYLAIWAAAGLVAYTVYQPHGTAIAGAIVVAAGLYELTPFKRRCRERCRHSGRSGLGFGIACLGSTIGVMTILFAINPMNITWMVAVTVLVFGQRWLPPAWTVDIPVALAVIALGIAILVQPSSVPGLMPSM